MLEAITAADRKSDQRTNLTLETMHSMDRNNNLRTAATLVAISAADRRNDERNNNTLEAIDDADRKNNARTALTLEAVAAADRNNLQQTLLTIDAINATDRNNNQRFAATLSAINGTNVRADERTAMTMEAIIAADRNNENRNYATLAAINTADKRSFLRTSTMLSEIINSDRKNNQRTIAMTDTILGVNERVAVNFAVLLQSFKVISKSYRSIEALRYQMYQEFNKVLEYSTNSRIEPIISKLKNFIQYYASEKQRISNLPRSKRVSALLDEHGLLPHLRESRTPRGDSLQSFMFEVMNQGYAIPSNQNDTLAMSALSSLVYGCRTQISVMYYLIQQYLYLADESYRNQDLEGYNNNIDTVETVFEGFRHSLIGGGSNAGLIDQIIGIIKKVARLEFVRPVGGITFTNLMKLVAILESHKSTLLEASLPIVSDIPPKLTTQVKFLKSSPETPLGPWEAGARVSYAVQYRNRDNWYSKIGEWSSPFKVKGKSNPHLRVPANSMYTRLLFRKFNNDEPEYVGILAEGDQIDFIDIDRDLYDAASNSEEAVGMQDAEILISNGANLSATFDFGRNFLHAAAISNNAELAKEVLLKSNMSFDINAKDNNWYTALHLAAETGSVNFIELLLELGADINAQTILGSTPLHLAAASGYTLAVEALIKSDQLQVNAQDIAGASALHRAVMSGQLKNVKMLLSHMHIDNNVRSQGGLTPLHMSSLVKHPEVSEILLRSYGTNLNSRSEGNLSALHLAAITGNLPVLQLLSMLDGTDMNPQSVNGWTPLHYAVTLQKENAVFELLKCSNVIVDVPGKGRITPLHLAATTGQSIVISELLAHGADLELPTIDGLTAFHLAAANNNYDAMTILAGSGANINAKSANGSTPLHLAAAHGHVQILSSILATPNIQIDVENDYGETPLRLAEENGHNYVIAALKEKVGRISPSSNIQFKQNGGESGNVIASNNAEANSDDEIQSQPPEASTEVFTEEIEASSTEKKGMWGLFERCRDRLHEAASLGRIDDVQNLLGKGMDVNVRDYRGYTALHKAAGNGHAEMVEYLIVNGANPMATGDDGRTALVHATYNNHYSVVAKLVERDAHKNTTSNQLLHGMDAFHIAIIRNNSRIAALLADQGANVNARFHDGNSVLHIAVKLGNKENVMLLLKSEDININTKNVHGDTPLRIAEEEGVGIIGRDIARQLRWMVDKLNLNLVHASKYGSLEYIKFLLEKGADPMARVHTGEGNFTACFIGLSQGEISKTQFFVDKGCDVNTENGTGVRPLHGILISDRNWYEGSVQLLVEKGANVNARTNSGDTPLHYAAKSDMVFAFRYLIKMGADVNVKNDQGFSPEFQKIED